MKKRFVALVLAMFVFAGAFAIPVVAYEGIVGYMMSDPCVEEYVEIAPLFDEIGGGLVGTRPRSW